MKKLTTITTACLAAAAMAAVSIGVAEAGPQKKGKYGGNYASAEGYSKSHGEAKIYPVFPKPPKRPPCKSNCQVKVKEGPRPPQGPPSFQDIYKQWSDAKQRNKSTATARGPNAKAMATAWADAWADTWIKEREYKKYGGKKGRKGRGDRNEPGGESISSSNNNGNGNSGGHGGSGSGSSSSSGTSAGASGGSSASASTGS